MTEGISPPPFADKGTPRRNRTPLVIGIIVGSFVLLTLMVGLCAGLLLPTLRAARNSTRMLASQANLREIGTALQSYAADNRDELPEAGADLKARLAPYLGPGTTVWDTPRPEGAAQAYYYVPVGAISNVKEPSKQPLVYEAPGMWVREGGNILYVDGSVRHTDGLAYRTLIDKLTLPDGKPWTPHR